MFAYWFLVLMSAVMLFASVLKGSLVALAMAFGAFLAAGVLMGIEEIIKKYVGQSKGL